MMADQNFKGQLINRCNKNRMTYDFPKISVEGPSHDHRFLFHAIVNGEKLGEGKHETKKGAENIAAKMALSALHAQEQSSPSAPQNPSQSPQLDRSSSDLNTSTEESSSISCDTKENTLEINYVGRLNELRQRKKWQRLIFSDRQGGPPHIPEIFCNVIIEDRHFPETTGKNKSEAKRNAAFLALQILKKENPDDSEIPDLNGSFGSESASGYSTPEKSSEDDPSSSESKDSIVFSSNLTPAGPTKPLRKIELAPTFCNKVKARSAITCNDEFLKFFDTISELSSGGFGTVYKARKIIENKYYVVKKVEFCTEKALSEVRALAELEHPNIVRYFHSWCGKDRAETSSMSGESDIATNGVLYDFLFIQMQWCEHGNLKAWIEKMTKTDKEQSLNIFRQIVEGVVFIHFKRLIHRDIKPENIFFATQTTITIGDFGLVADMPREDEKKALQRTKDAGTKSYMAPEQKTNSYGNEVDIFPLGLILIELFMIFGTIMEKQTMWNNLRQAVLPPSFSKQYPFEESVITLMLSEDPKKRPSATDLQLYFATESLLYSKTV